VQAPVKWVFEGIARAMLRKLEGAIEPWLLIPNYYLIYWFV